jgi:hypothetical protein
MKRGENKMTRTFTIATGCLIAILFSIMALTGCGVSNVTTTLEIVITSAETAVGVLGATGTIPPAVVTQVDTYLTLVSQATSFAATELASSDSSAVKADKIIAQFASISAPILPPGIAQTIVAVIQAVANAVANFLNTIQPAATTGIHRASIPSSIKISSADKNTLSQIKLRADALTLKIATSSMPGRNAR